MSEIDDLKKINEELKIKIVELEFTSKLNKFIADQRAEIIKEILEEQKDVLKKTLVSDEKTIIKKMLERIQADNEKYDKLQNYLIKTFPKVVKTRKNNDIKSQKQTNENLSQSYIDENGNMYASTHIIDVTISLISKLKKLVDDMLDENDEELDIL